VSSFKTGEPCKVKLTYRNVPSVDFAVYKVDLMKLYLMRKNLDRITGINLAGIEPMHREKVELGDGKDYRDVEREVTFPTKDPGAYLVVAKGGEADGSGMILVSDLKLEVVEDPGSGRVRVNVAGKATQGAERAHVKVIGEANDRFRSGYADLRGVYVADDVRGKSTVIVRIGGEYAFFRGRSVLQPGLAGGEKPPEGKPAAPQEDLEKGLLESNRAVQGKNVQRLKKLYEQQKDGVDVQSAK